MITIINYYYDYVFYNKQLKTQQPNQPHTYTPVNKNVYIYIIFKKKQKKKQNQQITLACLKILNYVIDYYIIV